MSIRISSDFLKNVLTPILGFGIAGAIWGGWDLYGSIPIGYPLTAVGAISLGVFGGLGLSIFSGDIKQILKTLGFGLVGYALGFILAMLGIYVLFLWGTWVLSVLPNIVLLEFIRLEPSLKVGAYWLNFALAGTLIGLFLALAMRVKIWTMIWRGAAGFGFGAVIAPIIGNLIGNLFGSLFVTYLVTFTLIGVVLGFSLVIGGLRRQASP